MPLTSLNRGPRNGRPKPYRFYLLDVEADLSASLASALRDQGCRPASATESADILFCSPLSASVDAALARAAGRPVIAVSRLPETAQWLDALEAGAADYCAAPFESIHVRWLLDRYCRPRPPVAAAVA
jgi:hypothetical protein